MDHIDVNFTTPMSQQQTNHSRRQQIVQKYIQGLRQLRTLAETEYQVHPYFFDNYVLFRYFQQQTSSINDTNTSTPPLAFLKVELLKHLLNRRRQIFQWLSYILLAFFCVSVYLCVPSFLYPGMRMWRRITLPVIQQFPRLTEFYDESCLMENPFFEVDDLSCEPCAQVQNVLQMETLESYGVNDANTGKMYEAPSEFTPIVFKINQTPIQLDDFYNVYTQNSEIFRRDAYRVQSTHRDVTNLEELFNQFNATQRKQHNSRIGEGQVHNLWRCNRMLPARLLRQVFAPLAPRLPTTGIALERYIAIDTPQALAYNLPDTECANVFVQQAQGTRFIILRPTSACRHVCRTLSMRLPQSFVLSYNWWYWKPISAPDPVSDTISISLIGSHC